MLVLVLFPLLAYGLVTWLSDWEGLGSGGQSSADDSGAIDEPTDPGTEGEAPVEGDAEPDPATPVEPTVPVTPTPPAPTADLSRDVAVFNSTNTSGLAGSAAERVEEAGFTSVSPGNWDGEDPEASVVYYPAAADVATAQAVATALGISAVVESAAEAGERIVVVLASDYTS